MGDPVVMGSVAAVLGARNVASARVICPLEAESELLRPCDLLVEGEEGVEESLAGADHVVADELYAPIVPAGCTLHALPHQAFSGRNSWKGSCDLVTLDVAGLARK